MSLAAWVLAFGGAVSFAAGAASGFWLGAWMRGNPGRGWQRYRMTLHKEALWSSFLCFAVAGIVDRLALPGPLVLATAVGLVATGWGAIAQYTVVARAGIDDLTLEPPPPLARVFGAAAMAGNLGAIVLLLVGVLAAFPGFER